MQVICEILQKELCKFSEDLHGVMFKEQVVRFGNTIQGKEKYLV